MVRKEQPLERFQVLRDKDVQARKDGLTKRQKESRVPTLEDMAGRVKMIIEAREKAEADASANADQAFAGHSGEMEEDNFQAIETLEEQMFAHGTRTKKRKGGTGPGPKKPAKKAAPKGSAKKGSQAPTAPETQTPAPARSPTDQTGDADNTEEPYDELAEAIVSKIGGDAKAVRNLDVQKILLGEKMGRSVYGVPWMFKFSWF